MWFRVFAAEQQAPPPAELLARLESIGLPARGDFTGDDLGWFRVDLTLAETDRPVRVERFLDESDDVRDDLTAWAAWLESEPETPITRRLMQHLIGTRQVFTLECSRAEAEDEPVGRLCEELCRYLCGHARGVYQVDGRGFFGPDGAMLHTEGTEHAAC
jgi:hypothetical protein